VVVLARLQLTLAGALLLVAVVLAVVLVSGDDGNGGEARAVGPTGFYGAVAPDGVRPAFTLKDQDGKVVSLADLRGKTVVASFLYSTCQDTCPVTAQQIRLALDELGDAAKDVPTLAISVDPPPIGGDTPLNAKRFLNKQSLTGRMDFLLGTRAQLQPIWKAFGIQPQGQGKKPAAVDPAEFEHSAKVIVIDAQGRLRLGYPVSELTPEDLSHDLKRLTAGA
jgi:protein SCO1/2